MEEKRKPSGRPTGENVGAKLKKRRLGMIDIEVYTPNITTFKTTQIRLSGWIKPVPDATQREYDLAMRLTKHRLKRMVRDWSTTYQFYQPESIVVIDTSDVTPKSKVKPHQFFKVDVVLYTRPDLKYSKYLVTTTTQSLAENVIEILDDFPEFWDFTVNNNWEKRKQVNV